LLVSWRGVPRNRSRPFEKGRSQRLPNPLACRWCRNSRTPGLDPFQQFRPAKPRSLSQSNWPRHQATADHVIQMLKRTSEELYSLLPGQKFRLKCCDRHNNPLQVNSVAMLSDSPESPSELCVAVLYAIAGRFGMVRMGRLPPSLKVQGRCETTKSTGEPLWMRTTVMPLNVLLYPTQLGLPMCVIRANNQILWQEVCATESEPAPTVPHSVPPIS